MSKRSEHRNPRIAAFLALNAVDNGSHADRAINKAVAEIGDVRDRGLATEIVYGVLRWRARLDYEISPQLRGKTNPALLNILRIGLYQLRFLDRVPPHAALNSAVEIAKREGFPFAAGMINAVLRNLQRAGVPEFPEGDDSVSALAVRYSHPEWLVRGWLAQLGLESTKALMAAVQNPAPITLRIRDGSVEGALAFFSELDISAERGRYAPHSVRVTGGGNPQEWGPVQDGRWVLQDEAAQIMANLLPPSQNHLDLCAAPGGKAFLLADRDEGTVIEAVDAEPTRVSDLTAFAKKLELTERIHIHTGDARHPVLGGKTFPSVLVDAPCSGLGTLRRNPDRKWKPAPPHELPRLQLQILRQAAEQTAPGGHLLYITCTIWEPENEGVVEKFEEHHSDWIRVRHDHPFLGGDGLYRSRPDLHGTDGFFAALWRAPL